jgi:superfamily II DNA or RNA helicase
VTQNSAAEGPARPDVAQRIGRFLRGLERARRQPNRREAYHLRLALERLRAQEYSESDAAMLNAERCAPLPAQVASLVTTNETVTVAQLQQQLADAVAAKS